MMRITKEKTEKNKEEREREGRRGHDKDDESLK